VTLRSVFVTIAWHHDQLQWLPRGKALAMHYRDLTDRSPGIVVVLAVVNHAGVPVDNGGTAGGVGLRKLVKSRAHQQYGQRQCQGEHASLGTRYKVAARVGRPFVFQDLHEKYHPPVFCL